MQRAKHSFFKNRAVLYSAILAIQATKNLERQKIHKNEETLNTSRYQIPKVISV
jgi:hypothetical protein